MRNFLYGVILSVLISLTACAQENQNKEIKKAELTQSGTTAKITFVELGSVNCIPCKMMQPVMKAIEEKYGDQVKVVFHDVWKPEEKHFAQKYGVKLIPTQVFLDEDGKEFHRHEGFYPEEAIDKILIAKGLKPATKEG